jgi:hypothetical protein
MSLGVTILLIGVGILGAVIGLFYLKGRLESPTLARIAHSELMMRFTVFAAALIVIGILLILGNLFSWYADVSTEHRFIGERILTPFP